MTDAPHAPRPSTPKAGPHPSNPTPGLPGTPGAPGTALHTEAPAIRSPLFALIGFMGAGKSTLARMLSAELGCPLIDLDEEIARIHGPIPELFATRGESGFRAIEHHELDRVLDGLSPQHANSTGTSEASPQHAKSGRAGDPIAAQPAVLALGGGAFLQEANRQLLERHSATVIFLDAPFEVLYERIRGTAHERPLAGDPDRLRSLYELRRPTYLLAHYTIDTSSGDPAALLSSLVQLANRLSPQHAGPG